jgi:hypothetical protein
MNGWMNVNNELRRMWKGTDVASFKVVCQKFSLGKDLIQRSQHTNQYILI